VHARKYADALGNAAYVNCAVANDYGASLSPPPAGFTVQVTSVEYWNGDATATFGASQGACESAGDQGAQRLNLRVTQSDTLRGVVENVLVVKRSTS
jgi:hypothetical protein